MSAILAACALAPWILADSAAVQMRDRNSTLTRLKKTVMAPLSFLICTSFSVRYCCSGW